MASPFTSISCAIRYDNARVLTWTLKSGANYPDDFLLQVENSRAGGPWSVLTSDAKDCCSYVDTRKRNYNKYMNECYRVRLVVPSTKEEWVSDIVEAGKFQAYPFSSEAENVIKQIEKNIELSGCTGVLLKKKHWGTRCPDCTDFDGQQTVNEHCPRCLGTGYDGGYYNGISMAIIKDNIKVQEEQGEDCVEAAEIVTARCVAYPWVRYGDVWCEDGTNKRYMVGAVTPSASYKQTTLVYTIVLHRIEYSDVLHSSVADDKITMKDLFDSSEVNYTPIELTKIEQVSNNEWKEGLDEL